ncbi:MAG TPA: hypothetical protein VMM56_02925, partial [Planctomycetaceae bacterium]|nr:hypothetical protein [Planctomycetaceae bacterium]
EGLRRIFVPKDAPPGAYTVYLNSQAQESYERNPKAVAESKARQDQADADQKAADEANKLAVAAQTKAVNDAKAADDKSKQAAQAFQVADKALKDAQAATTKVEQDVKTAQDAVAKADADLKTKTEEAEIKAAQDVKTKAEADLKAKQDELAKAQADLKVKTEAQTKSAEEMKTAETALTQANEAKTTADADAKAKADALKAAQAAKAAADKNFTDISNANKAKPVNLTVPSTPVMIVVKEAPAEITAAVPGGGNLKQGATLEVKITVQRKAGFEGPVNVTLPLPPGVTGLKTEPLSIPPDQTEGILKILAEANGTEGKIENIVVRGEMDHRGKASVDAPVALTITK